MEIIYLLIFVSFLVAVFFLFAFIWAIKNRQYEDDQSPAVRILIDRNSTTSSSHSTLK